MMELMSKCLGEDERAKGKYKPTDHNTHKLLVVFFEAIKNKKIDKIRYVGKFIYKKTGNKNSVIGFEPYRNIVRRLDGSLDRPMPAPRLTKNEHRYLTEETGLMTDDVYLAMSSLTTYILERLKSKGYVEFPGIGTIRIQPPLKQMKLSPQPVELKFIFTKA